VWVSPPTRLETAELLARLETGNSFFSATGRRSRFACVSSRHTEGTVRRFQPAAPLSLRPSCCLRRGISAGLSSGGISRDCSRCNSLTELQRAVRNNLSSLPGGGDATRHTRNRTASRSRSRSKSPPASKKKTKNEKKKEKEKEAAAAKKKADAAAAKPDRRNHQQCYDFKNNKCYRGDDCIFAHGKSTGFSKIDRKRGGTARTTSPDRRRSRSRSRSRRDRSRSRSRGRGRSPRGDRSRSRDRRDRSRSRTRKPGRSRSKSPGGTLRLANKPQSPQNNFRETISTWNNWIDKNWTPKPSSATCKDCCFFAHFGKCNKNADGTKAKGEKDSCPVCRGGSRANALSQTIATSSTPTSVSSSRTTPRLAPTSRAGPRRRSTTAGCEPSVQCAPTCASNRVTNKLLPMTKIYSCV